MNSFRDALRKKQQAIQAIGEEEKKKHEAEKLKRLQEFNAVQVKRRKKEQAFTQLTPMVSKVLEILGSEIWGEKYYFFKRYKIENKYLRRRGKVVWGWTLSHYLKTVREYYSNSIDYTSVGPPVRFFEGYTIELVFSNDQEPLCFIINERSECSISQEKLEQELVKIEPYTWEE